MADNASYMARQVANKIAPLKAIRSLPQFSPRFIVLPVHRFAALPLDDW
jgi:hypothetical protein